MPHTYVERFVRFAYGLAALSLLLFGLVQLTPGGLGAAVNARPPAEVIPAALGTTLNWLTLGLLYALPLALALGVPAGLWPRSLADRILQAPAVALMAIPPFLLVLFSIRTIAMEGGAAIPVAAKAGLTVLLAGWLARAIRNGIANRRPGSPGRTVVAVLGRILQQSGNLLLVMLVVETSGGGPAGGLGRLLQQAAYNRDHAVVHGALLVLLLLAPVGHLLGDLLVTAAGDQPAEPSTRPSRSWLTIGVFCTLVLLVVPFGPSGSLEQIDIVARFKPPGTPGHMLGTDFLGRDVLTRMVAGARTSLVIALMATVLSMFPAAVAAGIARVTGKWGTAILAPRVGVPGLLGPVAAGLVFTLIAKPSVVTLIVSLGLACVPAMVQAFRHAFHGRIAAGAGFMLLVLAQALLAENTLSFLGFGVQPPSASLGSLAAGAMPYLRQAPHMLWALVPGAVGIAGLFLTGHALTGDADTQG